IHRRSAELRAVGDFAGQEAILKEGYRRAIELENHTAQIAYLTGIANTRLFRFRYDSAVDAYLEAKRLAEESRDWYQLGAIDANLVAAYEEVGDYSAAAGAAESCRQ